MTPNELPTTIADVAESLMTEYEVRLPMATISSVVLSARSDLAGQTTDAALPELLHRLARERLEDQLARA